MPPHDPHAQHPSAPVRSRYTTADSSGRHRRDAWKATHRASSQPYRLLAPTIAAAVLVAAAAAGFLGGPGEPDYTSADAQAVSSAPDLSTARLSAADDVVTRSQLRKITPTASPSAKPTRTAKPKPKPKPKPSPTKAKPSPIKKAPIRVRPVAGLTQAQMDNAAVIVRVAGSLGLPKRAAIIGVATAMQESRLYNLASHVVPASLNYPHQGTGSDHDSVGLFQQRASGSWGTVKEIMTPATSAKAFYQALMRVDGWQNMSVTRAAQTVQVSAYPNAYAKHEDNATAVVNALLP